MPGSSPSASASINSLRLHVAAQPRSLRPPCPSSSSTGCSRAGQRQQTKRSGTTCRFTSRFNSMGHRHGRTAVWCGELARRAATRRDVRAYAAAAPVAVTNIPPASRRRPGRAWHPLPRCDEGWRRSRRAIARRACAPSSPRAAVRLLDRALDDRPTSLPSPSCARACAAAGARGGTGLTQRVPA